METHRREEREPCGSVPWRAWGKRWHQLLLYRQSGGGVLKMFHKVFEFSKSFTQSHS